MISRLQFANDYYDLQAIEMFLSFFLFFETEKFVVLLRFSNDNAYKAYVPTTIIKSEKIQLHDFWTKFAAIQFLNESTLYRERHTKTNVE